jgi:superfamily II DNA or RNA helicase
MISIEKFNDVFIKIHCEDHIAQELSDYFTFEVPNAKFSPAVKKKKWDGKIRLFNKGTHHIYTGLLDYVIDFAQQNDYEYELISDFSDEDITLEDVKAFVETIGLPEEINGKPLEKRDYQYEAVLYALRKSRALLISPTASGKSLIIYIIYRFYNLKTLLIVPTTALIHQMFSDFKDYGYDSDSNCHLIYTGQEKDQKKQLYISTWQSIQNQPAAWFKQFDIVLGDEAHHFQAKSLTGIMNKLTDCRYRFGFTGTLSGAKTHKLVLEGLFGTVKKVTTTAELMKRGYVADLKMKVVVLKYSEFYRRMYSTAPYKDEISFLISHEPRNDFIADLALSLKGNTLILYLYVDKHGKNLYDKIKDKASDREVLFVSGQVSGEDRDLVRRAVGVETNTVVVASYGTFSTGINAPNLHNVILASPSKSRIRNLQSIGRSLRKSATKDKAVVYDIADDLSWEGEHNYTLLHSIERVKMYVSEKFDYKFYNITLKDPQ